jgi:hypothetical protein
VRLPLRFRLALLLSITCLSPLQAHAQDVCTPAYERAQELRLEGDLLGARKELLQCSQTTCAEFMQQDCARWLAEVEAAQPSIVLRARDGAGRYLTKVRVNVDGKLLTTELDGRAVPLNPGKHQLQLETEGHTPLQLELFLAEGQRGEPVEVKFESTAPPPAASPTKAPAGASGRSLAPAYVLGSLGVVGLAGFAIFAVSGSNAEADLRNAPCARTKTCQPSDTDPVERKYLFADISLGVGVAALGVATYLFLSQPSEEAPAPTSAARFDLRLGPSGGFASIAADY